MLLGRFEDQGRIFFGSVEGDQVVELDGSPFDRYEATNCRYALSALKLLVPCSPVNFYCAGNNYIRHIEWSNRRFGTNIKRPETAQVGYRSPSALLASGEAIMIPADSRGPVQYEAELVVIIGKTARHVSEVDALSCVLGYTLGNDLIDRAWREEDQTLWRAKNCDTFKPMGPFIATGLDPMDIDISVHVNGKKAAEYSTSKMLFSAQHFIAKITQYITLHPGDVLWLGTDGACEPDLRDGDVVEIANDRIGVLRNPLLRAKR